jgi:hypothetical protein
MSVEIGAEAALFPEKEFISGIFVAVWVQSQHFPTKCMDSEWKHMKLCSLKNIKMAKLDLKMIENI